MIALDYIIEVGKLHKIPSRLVPVLVKSLNSSLDHKTLMLEFDSELIDIVELIKVINGVF